MNESFFVKEHSKPPARAGHSQCVLTPKPSLEMYSVVMRNVNHGQIGNHENTPDIYWAALKAAGIQLRFDEQQRLRTVFCYMEPHEGFDRVAPEEIGVPVFETFDLAEKACQAGGIKYQMSRAPGLWLKVHGPGYDAHYEFKDGRVYKVTLMLP